MTSRLMNHKAILVKSQSTLVLNIYRAKTEQDFEVFVYNLSIERNVGSQYKHLRALVDVAI